MIPIERDVPAPKHGSRLGKEDNVMIHSFPLDAAPIHMIGDRFEDDETIIGIKFKSDAILVITRFDVNDDVEI